MQTHHTYANTPYVSPPGRGHSRPMVAPQCARSSLMLLILASLPSFCVFPAKSAKGAQFYLPFTTCIYAHSRAPMLEKPPFPTGEINTIPERPFRRDRISTTQACGKIINLYSRSNSTGVVRQRTLPAGTPCTAMGPQFGVLVSLATGLSKLTSYIHCNHGSYCRLSAITEEEKASHV